MSQLLVCLLTLLISLRSPALEGNTAFWQSSLAAKTTLGLETLSQAAAAAERGGLTATERSLTKHGAGARPGNTLFPAARGNPASINQAAQNVVDDILTTPGSTLQNSTRGRFGPDGEPWRIDYQDALKALDEAKRRLSGG